MTNKYIIELQKKLIAQVGSAEYINTLSALNSAAWASLVYEPALEEITSRELINFATGEIKQGQLLSLIEGVSDKVSIDFFLTVYKDNQELWEILYDSDITQKDTSVSTLVKMLTRWLKYQSTFWGRLLSKQIKALTSELTAVQLSALENTLKGKKYWRAMSALNGQEAITWGSIDAIHQSGIKSYKIQAIRDRATCAICKRYDGSIWTIEVAQDFLSRKAATPPDQIVNEFPFPREKDIAQYKEITESPYTLVPFHSHCFSEDTEVYTSNGWEFFQDVDYQNVQFLSLTEERHIEWVSAINKVSYPFNGNLLHYHSRWYDQLVTDGHQIPYMYGRDKDIVKLRSANDFTAKSCAMLPLTGIWEAEDELNSLGYDQKLFAAFMGIYLSEGSFNKRDIRIKISQNQRGNLDKIEDLCSELFIFDNLYFGQEYIEIDHEPALYAYLKQFGHSYQKYCPSWILNSSKDTIQSFLDWYHLGDGTTKKQTTHSIRGKEIIKSDNNKSIATSSVKMAGHIGECILKVGGRPSYIAGPNAGTEINDKKAGKIYYTNHDMHVISMLKTKHAIIKPAGVHITEEPYDGVVSDVELERNHILWVRRNGKVCWSGNCRCRVVPL